MQQNPQQEILATVTESNVLTPVEQQIVNEDPQIRHRPVYHISLKLNTMCC